MQSTTSFISMESKTVYIGGSEPTLVDLGGGKASGLALPLPSTVTLAESTSGDVDPFLVQIDKDDPNHPRVRT